MLDRGGYKPAQADPGTKQQIYGSRAFFSEISGLLVVDSLGNSLGENLAANASLGGAMGGLQK